MSRVSTTVDITDVPARIDATIPVLRIARALASEGLTITNDGKGRLRISEVPALIVARRAAQQVR